MFNPLPGGLGVKNLSASGEDARVTGLILGLGRPHGEEMATHSSILGWEISWIEEPGGLQSTGSQKNQDMTQQLNNNNF